MNGLWTGNNASNAKLEFLNARQALVDAGIDPQTIRDAALTQSYLRLEQPLTTTANLINFPVLNNQTGNSAAIRANEVRLNLQDAFYVAGISIFLSVAADATTDVMPLYSYPNPVAFALGGAAPAPLWTFYGGRYSIIVNGITIVPKYPLLDFYESPETQLTAATNSPIDQFAGAKRISLQPNPVFIGQKSTNFSVEMNANVSAVDPHTYIVIIAHGILAQNVTIVS
jgi:hypothetical protein